MINVYSDFESGAIQVVQAEASHDIQLAISSDNKASSSQWFYFAVETPQPSQQMIRLANASKSSFPEGWNNYQAFASYDRVNWFRVETSYLDGELQLRHNAEEKTVYYAYFVPYTADRQARLNASLGEHASISVLGQTPAGRDIELIKFASEQDNAKNIWIIARQHPGESMAQWIIEGIAENLMKLRRSDKQKFHDFNVYLVTNMNPDGAAIGNHRTNFAGIDLNRQWLRPDPESCPEVHLVKLAMLEIGVDAFIDIHGDESLPYNFIMLEDNHETGEHFKEALSLRNQKFQTAFDYSTQSSGCGVNACGTSCGQQKATRFVSNQFSVPALLLEASFKNIMQKGEQQKWDHEDCLALGEDIAELLPLLL